MTDFIKKTIEHLNVNETTKINKSIHWQNFIKDKFKNITTDKLKNFRYNGLSDGLDNSRKFSERQINKKIEEFKLILKKFDYEFKDILKRFDDKNVGNNNIFVKIDKYFIDFNQINIVLSYLLIEKYILKKTNLISNVLEIGAGYGNLAKILLQDNKLKYFMVDLPENLLLQIYYLNQNYPELKIYLNKGEKIHIRELQNYDLFFFTPDQINNIDNSVNFDLVINTSSFMEMEKKSINEYFKFIQSRINIEGYLFNINRYFKDTVNQKIRFYEYPYDFFWNEIYSEVFIGFRRLHCLIVKRVNNKNYKLKDTFAKIKDLSKNHEYSHLIPIRLMKIIRIFKKLIKK